MAKLTQKIANALNEARVLILVAQVIVHGEVSEVQVRAVLAGVMFPVDGGCDGGQAPGG